MKTITYKELQKRFGDRFLMPSEDIMRGEEIVYRCPYSPQCPMKKQCFILTAPRPLSGDEILNVKCSLCGGIKIPIYANVARVLK